MSRSQAHHLASTPAISIDVPMSSYHYPSYYNGYEPRMMEETMAEPAGPTDPQLLVEELRELYVQKGHLFKKLFPKVSDEVKKHLEKVLDAHEKQKRRKVKVMERNFSFGSPRTQSREGELRLERFKVRQFHLEDDNGQGQGQGQGQGGPKGGTINNPTGSK